MNAHEPMRRRLLLSLLAGFAVPALAASAGTRVDVWKDPNCGCCGDWVKHLEAEGFAVRVFNTGADAARRRLGLPDAYASCHTALVDGYVLEGHVPAADVRRLLAERPAAIGLAVPGMPVGSPGMDGSVYGGRRDPYEVLLVRRDGRASVFASYR
ncbi:DUF411 domain-containing protein [uncultured Dechloromonas sp.]|uniref:DUF411 domain-containing protein n=1 Tax=uncultured Dechloromonas sp. TaxID=171719 RepID=UPI0025EBA185|nr:DUF411 domain-containing protein [uncultured Dechloromonas sp.]